jgi:hypothetical protein
MERENRYTVFKNKDIEKYLNQTEIEQLNNISERIAVGRLTERRNSMNCVVVESDWPEYEIVWKMIEERVDNAEEKL